MTKNERERLEVEVKKFEDSKGIELILVEAPYANYYFEANYRVIILLILLSSLTYSYLSHLLHLSLYLILVCIAGALLSKIDMIQSLFINENEKDNEVIQNAIRLFSDYGSKNIENKPCVLLALYKKEKKIQMLFSPHLNDFLQSTKHLNNSQLQSLLKSKKYFDGFIHLIQMLDDKIPDKAFNFNCNQFCDQVVVLEKGYLSL